MGAVGAVGAMGSGVHGTSICFPEGNSIEIQWKFGFAEIGSAKLTVDRRLKTAD